MAQYNVILFAWTGWPVFGSVAHGQVPYWHLTSVNTRRIELTCSAAANAANTKSCQLTRLTTPTRASKTAVGNAKPTAASANTKKPKLKHCMAPNKNLR